MVFKKPNWGPPPEGYVAGLGRGATGFITRGDIGPSRAGEQTLTDAKTGQQIPAGTGRGRGRGQPIIPAAKRDAEEGPINDADFDVWNGFEGNHLGGQTSIF